MTIDGAFYGVYLSQILLMSLYVPSKVLGRARSLLASYPPSEFPKLYPVPVTTIEQLLRIFRHANHGLLVLGFALLAAAWVYGYTIDPAWQFGDVPRKNPVLAATGYTFLQALPFILFGYGEWRYFKQMRVVARNRIRTAELRARRLFDFVPPVLFAIAVAMYIGATLVLLFVGNFFLGMYSFAVMTICNVGLACCFVLHGRKQDPYQDSEDRARALRAGWQYLVVASILLSVIIGIQNLLIAFRLFHYIPLVVSLFIQVAAVMTTRQFFVVGPFGQRNFDVYKADANRGAL